jgi:hypothetical protein
MTEDKQRDEALREFRQSDVYPAWPSATQDLAFRVGYDAGRKDANAEWSRLHGDWCDSVYLDASEDEILYERTGGTDGGY